MKTERELEALKADWKRDPCWDIADTEGFEEHKEELWRYQRQQEWKWEEEHRRKIYLKSIELGIQDHPKLADYILTLEFRLKQLEEKK